METKAASVCVAAAAVAAGFYIYFGPTTPGRKRNKKGLCAGMHNLGNTCFMNSVFQGLASLSSFVSWLESYSWNCSEDKNVKLGYVMGELMKELNNEWYEDDTGLTATPIIQALRHHGWVIEPDQQDAHEFFQVLFSSLDDEIGELPAVLDFRSVSSFEKEKDSTDGSAAHRIRIPLVRHCSRRRSPFRGLLASQLVCKTCATKSPVKFDGCDSLSLSLPSSQQINLSLEDLLRQFVCSETVDSVKCKGCSQDASGTKCQDTKSTFVKRLTLGKVPQCLCIHVQRTYWHSDGIPYKNNNQVKYPEYLNLAPFMYMPTAQSPRKLRLSGFCYSGASTPEGCRTPTNDLKADLSSLMTSSVLSSFSFSRQNSAETRTRTVYRLTAVTAHLGDVSDGHYVTYRRFEPPNSSKPGVWLYTSDDFVDTVTLEEVLACNPYMVYYERCPAGFDFEPMVESIVEESVKNIVL